MLEPDQLADLIIDVVRQATAPLVTRINELEMRLGFETRLANLESRPAGGVKWCGVYVEGAAYGEGNLITRSGSLWLALKDTIEQPGSGSSAWKLVVKSGNAG